jgi:uncharacterized protein YfdQ (DUF2303 family)
MSLAWYKANGADEAFDDANHSKATQVLAEHTKRIAGEIDMAACLKKVGEIIG